LINYIRRLNYRIHLNISLGKGTLARAAREVDATVPASWEFSAFSQNGEDGIIEFLLSQIPDPARTFLEIGSADGLENNSTYLLLVRKFSGTAVEADPRRSDRAQSFLTSFNGGARFINTRVTVEDLDQLVGNLPASPPDVLSLDIDSIDYWIAARLLEIGVRPALWVVEYNSVFGPDAAVTVPADFGADAGRDQEDGVEGIRSLERAWDETEDRIDAIGGAQIQPLKRSERTLVLGFVHARDRKTHRNRASLLCGFYRFLDVGEQVLVAGRRRDRAFSFEQFHARSLKLVR